ncbi:CBS domain-containing protein [Wenzhouxiangella sp. XN79A]|uniref:DUF294 nucleotidyltransferase-like domain-containing protein n=1 Tax=Wenzhouxiangella sp. XN79A TaxID=2724193 RepID=UPI00144A9D40|nr:DUF294 nucleotidyltransferase-like domain-containing protein [Wenzhouxiangella sp. XN79A]NKI35838.1 CBS domain-containing protein [Wenzhouxiangella sp. XN79A]
MTDLPDDLTRFLAGVAPFENHPDAIAPAARAIEIRYLREGQAARPDSGTTFPEDPWSLYIVRSGAVALCDSDGRVLERRGEGELFGHPIRFGQQAAPYTVQAVEDCLLWQLSAVAVRALAERVPELEAFLSSDPGARLRRVEALRTRRERLADLGLRSPVSIGPDAPVAEAAARMAEHQVSCLPVVVDDRIVGILTDRDLRGRVVAVRLDPDSPVEAVMTTEPVCVDQELKIEAALVEMIRRGIHHMPVLADGRLAGVVSAGDLMRTQSPHPLRLVRDLARASDADAVARIARSGPALLAGLVEAGTDVTQLGRMAGLITDATTRRLIELAEAELGPAPVRYAWLAFGSQARLEQGLISDQDNGLLLDDALDADGEAWFLELAERVCNGLDAAGYVFCPGGVMAKGRWRMTRHRWRETFSGWMAEPDPKSVMHCSIFFDLRAVHGDVELAESLRRDVLEQARSSEIFRRFLAAGSVTHRPPIGVFRQFVQETGGDASKGLNLKKRGVIPIVDLARVHALEGALPEVHSEERLRAAAKAEVITERDADDLVHALRFIADIRLRHQVERLRAGEKPDHLVAPDALSGLHRRYLRSAFGIVREAQQALAQRYVL